MVIDPPSPEHGERHEHGAVGRVHPTERLRARLEHGDDAVEGQRHEARDAERRVALLPEPEPDEVATSALEDTGEQEERCRAHACQPTLLDRPLPLGRTPACGTPRSEAAPPAFCTVPRAAPLRSRGRDPGTIPAGGLGMGTPDWLLLVSRDGVVEAVDGGA